LPKLGTNGCHLFTLLIDTCVWLDLAKDHHQQALLSALEELTRDGRVSLVQPRTVLDEFERNKARIIDEGRQSLSSTLKRVKDVVDKFGDSKRKRMVLEHLNDVDHRLPVLGEQAIGAIGRIERLFKNAQVVEISDVVKLRAAQRAIDLKAPFHRQKNSINDAIIIETYSDLVEGKADKGMRYAFVTHNTRDFSAAAASTKLPHPDIAPLFSKIKSRYFTTLGETLRCVEPALLADIMIEQEWTQEPRRLKEILDAMDLLFHQVWYNRHMNLRYRIEAGRRHARIAARAAQQGGGAFLAKKRRVAIGSRAGWSSICRSSCDSSSSLIASPAQRE